MRTKDLVVSPLRIVPLVYFGKADGTLPCLRELILTIAFSNSFLLSCAALVISNTAGSVVDATRKAFGHEKRWVILS